MNVSLKNRFDEIRSLPSFAERIAALRGQGSGCRMWLLSCGPSLPRFHSAFILSGDIVVAVKQALRVYPLADFQLFNHVNFEPFDRAEREASDCNPLTIGYSVTGLDIDLPLQSPGWSMSSRVREFGKLEILDGALFGEIGKFHYGPGIVYEVALPLAVHLGVSEIVSVGFDCEDRQTRHFYDDTQGDNGGGGGGSRSQEHDEIRGAMPAWREWLEGKGVDWVRLGRPWK